MSPSASGRVRPRRLAPAMFHMESFGVPIDLSVGSGLGRARWAEVFPPRSRRRRPTPAEHPFTVARARGRIEVHAGEDTVWRGEELTGARKCVESAIALHVAATSTQYVFVHAGVVVHRGKALLLPGRSFAGKSTLVHALVARGARYFSDEYALLDAEGRVWPYARPVALRRASGERRIRMPQPAMRPVPVGWVAGLNYDGGADLALTPLSQGRVAMLLLDNAVAARLAPERVLAAVRAVALSALGWIGTRGECGPAVVELLHRCGPRTGMLGPGKSSI